MENLPTYRLTQSGPEAQEILDQVNLNTVDIEQLKRLYQALTQSEPEIIEPTDTWPVANPEENVIYRVIDRVNTPPQYYTDYMWNGTSMVPMAQYNNAIDNEPTANSNNLVKSGGVYSFVHANGGAYDISAAHAVGGVLATYDKLEDALGTDGANVPAAVRKGGMSIKYVQSVDNKYVQYRYLLSSTTDNNIKNAANWVGVTDRPKDGSKDLVPSDDLFREEAFALNMNDSKLFRKTDFGPITASNGTTNKNYKTYSLLRYEVSSYVGQTLYINVQNSADINGGWAIGRFIFSDDSIQPIPYIDGYKKYPIIGMPVTIPENAVFLELCTSGSNYGTSLSRVVGYDKASKLVPVNYKGDIFLDNLISLGYIKENFFDKNAEGIVVGKVIDGSNTFVDNAIYSESDYIPVIELEKYYCTMFDSSGTIVASIWPYYVTRYDVNKIPLYTTNENGNQFITIDKDVCFIRMAIRNNHREGIVISVRSGVSQYKEFDTLKVKASNVRFDQTQFNLQKGLQIPQTQVDFWDIVEYEQGLLQNDGSLANYAYRTIKYDISAYVGKELTLLLTSSVLSYASQFPICIIVKNDDTIQAIHANQPAVAYGPSVVNYTVQEGDKYLRVSGQYTNEKQFGNVVLMCGLDFNSGSNNSIILSPILKNSAAEVQELLEAEIELLETEIKDYCEYSNPQMFDKDAADIQTNKFINAIIDGEVHWQDWNGVNESDFVAVQAGTNVYKTDFDQNGNVVLTDWGWLAVCLFDANKNPINVVNNPSQLGYLPIPSGVSYIRFSYSPNNQIVISKGSNVTKYYEYLEPGYTVKDRIEDVNTNLQDQIDDIDSDIDNINQRIADITGDGSQWIGKTWYAYGTSITSVAQGKYVPYLAALSQMTAVNKGIPGGGIGDLGSYSRGQVRAAIMNTTDGKLAADLITLEVGANDTDADVPLGTIYDTDETTLCGCLNMCIRYLQQNTNAQIVIMPSPATTTIPNVEGKYYEAMWLFKQVCFINKCWWIDGMTNLGTAKIQRTDIRYVQDNIHQTELGGYVFAKAIWAELKRIPTFDIALPS